MLIHCCYLEPVVLLCREGLARFWRVHRWASWIHLGAYWKRSALRRKSMDESPADFKPAGWKDSGCTGGHIQLLEPATSGVEHWSELQHLGRRECQHRSEITRSWDWREWCGGWWHGHLRPIQLSRDEPQHLEPKQHQWIVRYVGLDVRLSWTKSWQLAATSKQHTRPCTLLCLCYIP